MTRVKQCALVLTGLASMLLSTNSAYGDDHKIRRVLVISIDGMHALDMALWIKTHPTSALGKLSAQGINYTNASTTKPSDSIPSTVGIFTGGSAAVGGMYYDDAYNRSWFAPTNLTCSGTPGAVIDLKFAINLNPDGTGGVDPAKMPRQLVNGVCTPVLPHNMMRLNTVFEIVRSTLGPTAYSEKRPSYEFLNGPSGTGVTDLYTPEINCQPHYTLPPPAAPTGTCANALLSLIDTEAFDDLRVQSVINEIDGKDHTGTLSVGVPVLFGMNFQALNAAKKDSLGGGYADDLGTPNSALGGRAGPYRCVHRPHGDGVDQPGPHPHHCHHHYRQARRVFARSQQARHRYQQRDPERAHPGWFSAHLDREANRKDGGVDLVDEPGQYAGVAAVLTTKANETALNIAQTLTGESLKLLFPDPLIDPASPDLVVVPNLGVNFEPTLNTALPAVQAEHGGLNENETHVPLMVVGGSTNGNPITPGIIRAAVTTTQIAPTILELLNLDPNALQAVRLENVGVLAGIKTDNGKSAH